MMKVKAPFNFVPLSDTVVSPEWASAITHDIPFSDGLSGTISVKLTARTPIFIRNGHTKEDAKAGNDEYASFSHIDKGRDRKYFLPATSVKGAIRNVLEILSFGKMRVDPAPYFAQRDWENTSLYDIKTPKVMNNMRCGWLRRKGEDDYEIIDCGQPQRISHKELDRYIGQEVMTRNFSDKVRQNLNPFKNEKNQEIDPKTAEFKYREVEKAMPLEELSDVPYTQTGNSNSRRVKVDYDSEKTGTVVLTGQPNLWKIDRAGNRVGKVGKFHEFVFPNKPGKSHPVSEEDFAAYKSMYADSPDWKYMVDNFLGTTGIPVFFRLDASKKLVDWGLAFLYKLPYKRSPFQALPNNHRDAERHDMAECIFGYTTPADSLKGRVQFSPFLSDNAVPDKECQLILGGPKASYYPIYIEQKGENGNLRGVYKTLNDGELKGWKRYILRSGTWEHRMDNENVDTKIHPLKAGAVFEGNISFHNLKPEELGALLSALTFHGNEGRGNHQLGMAKPYGFGNVKLDITKVDIFRAGDPSIPLPEDYRSYMGVFEKYMSGKLGGSWVLRREIRELLTLATRMQDGADFEYMKLDVDGCNNDFQQAKKDGTYLPYFSEIIKKQEIAQNLGTAYDKAIEDLASWRKQRRDEVTARKEEAKRIEAERLEAERKAEEERLEAERLEAERKAEEARKEEEEAKKTEHHQKILRDALSVLEGLNEYGRGQGAVNEYLEHLGSKTVPEAERPKLADFLKRIVPKLLKDRKKKKGWNTRTTKTWTDIEAWTDKSWTDALFNELNTK